MDGVAVEPSESVVVWVDGWQQECCGERWSVGDEVAWTVTAPDLDYLAPLFPPVADIEIGWAEEHHSDVDLTDVTGTVVAIDAVQLTYAPRDMGGRSVLYPTPGSARLTSLDAAEGVEFRWKGFAGYLVTLAR